MRPGKCLPFWPMKAAMRTTPFILAVYAVVALWYLTRGPDRTDINRARRVAPWYTKKSQPSFNDMQREARRHIWRESVQQGHSDFDASFVEDLLLAA